ncbi:MAG: hypothetical protein JWP97_107 [Labilithrix sp.]|nr:hypothetical protein [Labilithrix sp.]
MSAQACVSHVLRHCTSSEQCWLSEQAVLSLQQYVLRHDAQVVSPAAGLHDLGRVPPPPLVPLVPPPTTTPPLLLLVLPLLLLLLLLDEVPVPTPVLLHAAPARTAPTSPTPTRPFEAWWRRIVASMEPAAVARP